MNRGCKLDKCLAEIDSLRAGKDVDVGTLEAECIALLKHYTSPENKGKIFAAIAFIYAQNKVKLPEKIIHYCRESLKYPLPVTTAGQMYIFGADALQIQYQSSKEQNFSSVGKAIIKLCLNGLKLVLDNLTISVPQRVSYLGKFDHPGPENDLLYKKILRQHNDESESREKALFQNKLLEYYNVLINKCVIIYSQQPYSKDELHQFAVEIFKDDDAANKIINEIKASVISNDYPCQDFD